MKTFITLLASLTIISHAHADDEDLIVVTGAREAAPVRHEITDVMPLMSTNFYYDLGGTGEGFAGGNTAQNYSIPTTDALKQASTVTKAQAAAIFAYIAQNAPGFGYSKWGCEARAQWVVNYLNSIGLVAAKVFVTGDLFATDRNGKQVEWAFHVAVVLNVNENGIIVPYAFDPALMNSALPVGYWMAQMNDTSGNKSIYYTSPDQYLPPSFVDHRSHQIVGESYRDNQTFFEYNNTLSRLSQIQNFQDARAARTQGPPQD